MVWLVLVLALLSAASAADQPPNIIFILADDLVRLHFFYFFSCKNVLEGGLLLLSVKHLPTSQHLILVVLLLKTTRSFSPRKKGDIMGMSTEYHGEI